MIQGFFLILLIISLPVISGCNITGADVLDQSKEFVTSDLPLNVAKLNNLNLSSVEKFEDYKKVVDYTNTLTQILNENEELFRIPLIPEPTMDSYQKVSKTITRWSPLIDNYNGVVSSAKSYQNNTCQESLDQFYIEAGKFSLETALVVASAFAGFVFNGVGVAYRAVGLNRLAFSCPLCVSAILEHVHWFIRAILVNGSSSLADHFVEFVTTDQKIDYLENKTSITLSKIQSLVTLS